MACHMDLSMDQVRGRGRPTVNAGRDAGRVYRMPSLRFTIACGASKLDEAATIVGNQSFRLVKVVDVGNLTMTPRLLNVICKRPRSLVLAQHEGVSFVRC